MPLIALGISHRTAPVELREKVAIGEQRLPDALQQLSNLADVHEAAILSTCNRTEIYCHLSGDNFESIARWLSHYHQLDSAQFASHLYYHADKHAVRHMFRVAGGLDSMILGEPQILGQMKNAYQIAKDTGTLSVSLEHLFQHTFSVAKQIRTDTSIGESPVSVAFAATGLAKQIFSGFENHTALLIGAGETIELCARHLVDQKLGRLIIANRTIERAHQLATQFNGYGISLDEITAHLAEADIIITATGAEHTVLTKMMVETALKGRKHRPVFMVDIAVPRDIEASVSSIEDVYLYTVDDLQEVIQENLASRKQAALQAEDIIDVQTERFENWLRAQDAVSAIKDYRELAEQQRDEVLEKARQMLNRDNNAEQALKFLANTLTNKLLHDPSVRIREAAENSDLELLNAAVKLYKQDKK